MKYLILSCSLKPQSHSRVLAQAARERLERACSASGDEVDFLDLAELPLPACDADACYEDPNARELKGRLVAAQGILMAAPVYNFDLNSAAKNVVELSGREAWTGKVVGFMCSAGGRSSYMSVMGLANSLMLDFRTVIIPRFVYAAKRDFEQDGAPRPEVLERIEQLTSELIRFTRALAPPA